MISVIVPTFNSANYIFEALNSVLNQTYDDFEVICVDDCSTDNTVEILDYFSKKDSRIKYLINDKNMGPGYSRNKAINVSSGDYVFFLDSDDWILPNTLQLLHDQAENKQVDLLIFKVFVYNENYKRFYNEKMYDVNILKDVSTRIFNRTDLDFNLLFLIPDTPINKFYRKSFLDDNNIRFTNENLIYEDTLLFFSVITKAEKIFFINEYLYIRRRRENSVVTLTNERMFDVFKIFRYGLELFFKDDLLWHHYKKELIIFFFKILDTKYQLVDDELKPKFFKEIKNFFLRCYIDYGLHDLILENVDNNILKRFEQK